jgi:hypothetical protein
LGGGGNDAVKNTNTNEIQILFAGYHKPAKLGNFLLKTSICNDAKVESKKLSLFLLNNFMYCL